MTRTDGFQCVIGATASNPPISGLFTSSSTTSGRHSGRQANVSLIEQQVPARRTQGTVESQSGRAFHTVY